MDAVLIVVGLVIAAIVLWAGQYLWPTAHIVREHERALLYRKGHLVAEVKPGRYWLRLRTDELLIVDTRRRQAVVPGQEVLTADRVPLKVSLIAQYSVSSVTKALTEVDKYQEVLYAKIQLALRQAVAERDLDAALAERGDVGQQILDLVREEVAGFGLTLHSVSVRDFMMAGGLKNAYADVIEAKQRGLAALERARGESAAVRNLANAAQLLENHPGIMQLRLLQAVESGTGNRIVIALDPDRVRTSELKITAEGEA